jgi:hypothetical protein
MSITPRDEMEIEPIEVGTSAVGAQADQATTGLKVVLLDMDAKSADRLSAAGHRVSTGSFGTPYNYSGVRGSAHFSVVATTDGSTHIIDSSQLPIGIAENDVIVVDLGLVNVFDGEPPGRPYLDRQGLELSTPFRRSGTTIDPRGLAMISARSDIEQALMRGGVLIVFAAPRFLQKALFPYPLPDPTYRNIVNALNVPGKYHVFDNWGLSRFFEEQDFRVQPQDGIDITIQGRSPLHQLLEQYCPGAAFTCTIEPLGMLVEHWTPLAMSKTYRRPVAGLLAGHYKSDDVDFNVLVLPQIVRRGEFLTVLLRDVLPELAPHLFPHLKLWFSEPGYSLPGVAERVEELGRVEEEAQRRIANLSAEITELEKRYGILRDLLTEKDDKLVQAVKATFELMDFATVIDRDIERDEAGLERREDLRVIEPDRPVLLIDVTGSQGLSSDEKLISETQKHVQLAQHDLGDLNVHAITIINHQRNREPLLREDKSLMNEARIILARQSGIGLLSTWDLFRLARSYVDNKLRHSEVTELFYQAGRIDPSLNYMNLVPPTYQFVGVVAGYVTRSGRNIVGIRVTAAEFNKGDIIAFEHPVAYGAPAEYIEQDVTSVEERNQAVETAAVDMYVGVLTEVPREILGDGLRVFRRTYLRTLLIGADLAGAV